MSVGAELETRCEAIASSLRGRQLATDQDIQACYDQPADGELKWAFVYADLRVLLADRSPDKDSKSARVRNADRVILDALRGAPRTVTLSEPVDDLRELKVYPKSLNALIELAERDAVIGYFNAGLEALRELCRSEPSPERADHLARAVREIGYQERVCVWIVTHDNPGLPFPDSEPSPELPGWLSHISAIDALMIFVAHEEVNAGRLAALQQLPRGKKQQGEDHARGWGVYLANLASLMDRSAEQLSRDHSLAALFAQSYVHAIEQEKLLEKTD
jgi:hypothetical protein